jgi:hypothetical protein
MTPSHLTIVHAQLQLLRDLNADYDKSYSINASIELEVCSRFYKFICGTSQYCRQCLTLTIGSIETISLSHLSKIAYNQRRL